MARNFDVYFLLVLAALPLLASASPANVSFSSPQPQVDRYGYAEVTATVQSPDAANLFADASLTGVFETTDGAHRRQVEGFCDSADGSTFRIRFMAPEAAEYKYTVTYKQGSFQKTSQGTFRAVEAHKRGMVRVDPDYPWHFIWEGTGEHYFFNGTTAYWLVGWRDDRIDSVQRRSPASPES